MIDELRMASALLSIVEVDIKLPWSPVVTVADAALGGYAVHQCHIPPLEVRAVGQHAEMWRFRRSALPEPRETALEAWEAYARVFWGKR